MASKLGRGLAALIPDYRNLDIQEQEITTLKDIPVKSIEKNKYQPRQLFSDDTLHELAASIKSNGLIQPIVVRQKTSGTYELISGERRFRAVSLLGYDKIPALVKVDVSDQQSMLLSLLENIQREDINPIEVAMAYSNIMNEYAFTQQQLSSTVGKSRSSVANTLRLLELSEPAKEALFHGKISEGHARTLLRFKDHPSQTRLLQIILEKSLSVREAERLPDQALSKKLPQKASKSPVQGCPFPAYCYKRGKKGYFSIPFSSEEDYSRILTLLSNA